MEIKFIQPKDKRCNEYMEVAKVNNKIVAFIFVNDNVVRYAFGKPSQPSYIAFTVDSVEIARDRITEYHSNTVNMIKTICNR